MTEHKSGRPRDPDVDRRILDAALGVYGDAGWGRFTVEAVAKAAKVGKASIYLRWQNAEDLLLAALGRLSRIEDIDTGDVKSDLRGLAEQVRQSYLGPRGRAVTRLAVEARHVPVIQHRWMEVRESQMRAARSLVRRAIERSQLPEAASVTMLLDLLLGATTVHLQVKTSPDSGDGESTSQYLDELVDFLLASFRSRTVNSPDTR